MNQSFPLRKTLGKHDTSFVVDCDSDWHPVGEGSALLIGDEIVKVDRVGAVTLTVTRGFYGTRQSRHWATPLHRFLGRFIKRIRDQYTVVVMTPAYMDTESFVDGMADGSFTFFWPR